MRTLFILVLLSLVSPLLFSANRAIDADSIWHLGHQFYLRGEYARAIRKFNYLLKTFPDSIHTESARFEKFRAQVRIVGRVKSSEIYKLTLEGNRLAKHFKKSSYVVPLLLDQFTLGILAKPREDFPLEDKIISKIASDSWNIPEFDRNKLHYHYASYLESRGNIVNAAHFYTLAQNGFRKFLTHQSKKMTNNPEDFFISSGTLNLVDIYSAGYKNREATNYYYQVTTFFLRVYQNPLWMLQSKKREFPFIEDRNRLLTHIIDQLYWVLKKDEVFHFLPQNAFYSLMNASYYKTGRWDRNLLNLMTDHERQRFILKNKRVRKLNDGIFSELKVHGSTEISYRRKKWKKREKK